MRFFRVAAALVAVAAGVRAAGTYPFLRAGRTTYFVRGLDGREWNIQLAAQRLNGHVIFPGEEFSFNESVQWQIPTESLAPASSLVEGRRVPALGGGLCQVSSTVYAAFLEAGFPIVERHAHSTSVRYLPPGLDATVSSAERLDLKVRNDLSCPVMLETLVRGNGLTVRVLSTEPPDRTVEVVVRTLGRQAGAVSTQTFRTVRVKGGEPAVEVVSTDTYR